MKDIIDKIKNMDERVDNFIKTDDLKKLDKEMLSKEVKSKNRHYTKSV